ncbi:MAG: GNAT family protein [Actinomycetota bacterium]
MALVDHWPLFGLRITTPRLELRVPTDDDLALLVELIADIHDPSTMPFAVPWTDVASPKREGDALRHWWGARAEMTVERWDLHLAVRCDGELVGIQSIGATDFPTLRQTNTGSWIGRSHHGRGIGTEMRRAVVHLAFAHLGAHDVLSAAFTDNVASQTVSTRVGYEPNGMQRSLRRGDPADQIRYRLTRQRWEQTRTDLEIEVEGFEACRAMFGLDG